MEIKKGKPLAFGIINGKPVFGLPGNPVSAMVAFEQFVRPAILKMMGVRNIFRKSLTALLTSSLNKKAGRMHFIRAVFEEKNGQFYATPLEGQGSGVLSSMVMANSLIILPEDAKDAAKGSKVKVQPLDSGFLYQDKPGY